MKNLFRYLLLAFVSLMLIVKTSAQLPSPYIELTTTKTNAAITIKIGARANGSLIRILRNGQEVQNLTVGKTAVTVEIPTPGAVIRMEGALDALTCNDGGFSLIVASERHPLTRLVANGNALARFDASIFPFLAALSLTNCGLEQIDLTRNEALTNVNLNDNKLRDLDLSTCKNLIRAQFMSNDLDACALDAIYRKLPQLATMPKNVNLYNGKPTDSNEAQISTTKLAEERNWKVNFAGDGSGCIDPEIDPQLSFVTGATGELTAYVAFHTVGPHSLMVDWGDGIKQPYQKMQIGESTMDIKGIPLGEKITFYGDFKRFEITRGGITAIDTRFVPKIEYLGLRRNDIKQIDLSHNPELRSLYLRGNQIKELDLSHCPKIEQLYIRENKIQSIDLSLVPNLRELAISHNPLKDLDISPVHNLTKLYAMGLGLRAIDLSNCGKMYQLEIGGNELTSLDISACPELGYLNIEQNQLSACALDSIYRLLPIPIRPIDWKNLWIGEGGNDAEHSLTDIAEQRGWKPTVKGDGSGCDIVLERPAAVMITQKQIGETFALSVTSPARRFGLDLGDGSVKIYDSQEKLSFISSIKTAGSQVKIYGQGITQLVMTNDQLSSLSLPHCPLLNYLQVSANKLTEIDLSNVPALQRLYISKNKLNALNIKNNPALIAVFARSCMLSAEGLNAFIADLPNVASYEINPENEDYMRRLAIQDNPGLTRCDTREAIDKGWVVDVGLIESIADVHPAIRIYVMGEYLVVEGMRKSVELFDLNGRRLYYTAHVSDVEYIPLKGLDPNIFVLRVDNGIVQKLMTVY